MCIDELEDWRKAQASRCCTDCGASAPIFEAIEHAANCTKGDLAIDWHLIAAEPQVEGTDATQFEFDACVCDYRPRRACSVHPWPQPAALPGVEELARKMIKAFGDFHVNGGNYNELCDAANALRAALTAKPADGLNKFAKESGNAKHNRQNRCHPKEP